MLSDIYSFLVAVGNACLPSYLELRVKDSHRSAFHLRRYYDQLLKFLMQHADRLWSLNTVMRLSMS